MGVRSFSNTYSSLNIFVSLNQFLFLELAEYMKVDFNTRLNDVLNEEKVRRKFADKSDNIHYRTTALTYSPSSSYLERILHTVNLLHFCDHLLSSKFSLMYLLGRTDIYFRENLENKLVAKLNRF